MTQIPEVWCQWKYNSEN